MQILGVAPFQPVVADHGLFVYPRQTSGGTDPTPFLDMRQHRHDLVLVQVGVEQGGAFAFGKAGFAGPTVQQAPLLVFSVAIAHRQVFEATLTVVRTVFILATEARKIIHERPPER